MQFMPDSNVINSFSSENYQNFNNQSIIYMINHIYNIIATHIKAVHITSKDDHFSSFVYIHPIELTPTEKDEIIKETENISTSIPSTVHTTHIQSS